MARWGVEEGARGVGIHNETFEPVLPLAIIIVVKFLLLMRLFKFVCLPPLPFHLYYATAYANTKWRK